MHHRPEARFFRRWIAGPLGLDTGERRKSVNLSNT
jgi:hypothetical protein